MNYRKVLLGAVITCGVLSSQAAVASQAPMRPQAGPPQTGLSQAGAPHHPGATHSDVEETHPGKHPGKHPGSTHPDAEETHPGKHPGSTHPDAEETHPGKHPGKHSGAHSEAAHSGKKEPEKDITPVKKELIDALKDQKESSLHCTAEGKNHPLTPAVIEEKATKVKKKAGKFIVNSSKGPEVTCAK